MDHECSCRTSCRLLAGMQHYEQDSDRLTFDSRYTGPARTWLATVCVLAEKLPAADKLVSLLKPNALVRVVNQTNDFMNMAIIRREHSTQPDEQGARVHHARCAILIYYRVLQAVLSSHGTVATSNGRLSNAQQLAENSKLLQALMLCAIELTSYCITGNASFPAITSQLGHSCMALEVWQAVGLFLCYLPAETGIKLPDSVSSYLLFMRVRITEQLAWKSGSSVYQAICEGGGGSCAIGDYSLLSSLLDNVSALARSRTYATATVIGRSHATDADSISFIQHCNWVMTLVLEKHLDLLFGQHLSSIVACCVYSIVRVHQGTVSFKTIVDSMLQLFPHQSMQDFKQCEIQQATDHSVAVLGSTRQFYNAVFLPAIESILYEGFPDMPSTGSDHTSSQNTVEDPVSDQRKTGKFKQAMKERRPALQSLSAADLNVRAGKFRKMQG